MIPYHRYKNCIFCRPVDEAVFVVYAVRPLAGEAVFEGFRLSGAGERVAHDLMDEPVDAFEHMFVGVLPVEVVFPGSSGKMSFTPPVYGPCHRRVQAPRWIPKAAWRFWACAAGMLFPQGRLPAGEFQGGGYD